MKPEHSLAQLCAALAVTRSGYHAWQRAGPSARQAADTALRADIRAIHTEHRQRYGAPRIRHELQKRGQRHGTKRIARLMRAEGLRGRCAGATCPAPPTAAMTSPSPPTIWPKLRRPAAPIKSGSAT